MSKWINKTVVQLAEGATNNTGTTSTVNFTAAGAGNLLVAVAAGSVTSTTPTGWTLGASAIGSSGHYVWYKTAAANEASFSTTHNGGGYPNAFVVYEFPAGSTFVKAAGANGLAAGTANPTISALTGTNLLMASVSESYAYTTYNGTGITWPAGTTVDTDIHQAHVTTDGYWLGIGYAEDSTATSYGPNPTITDPNGVVASERLTWAIHVRPLITKVATWNGGLATASGQAGTANLTVPTGVTNKHLAVVVIADANSYTDTDTILAPAGWTKQADHPSVANNSAVYIYTKLGGYSAGQTITFTNNSGAAWYGYATWYDTQGYDIGVVGSIGGRAGTSSVNTVIPGITTTDTNQDIIVVATERTTATGTAITAFAGFTPTQDFFLEDPSATGNTGTSAYFGHYTKTAIAATGNLTITYSGGSGNGAGMMFAIQTPKTAPIAIVGTPTTSDGSTAVASAALSVPAGTKTGEILLATISTGSSGAAITPPSGWQAIQTDTDTSFNVWWTGYRVVDGTEAASYTWSWTSTTYHMMTMSRVGGVNTAAPIRVSNDAWGDAAATTHVGPSITGVQATDEEFYFFALTDSGGATQASAPTISSAFTADYSRVNATKSQILAHANAAGAVAAPTATTPANSNVGSVAFALQKYAVAAGPTAAFTASAISGSAPLVVTFTDTSTGTPTSWVWDFGDGTTATTQNATHTYTTAGTFTAKLTATNAGGSTSATRAITVTSPTLISDQFTGTDNAPWNSTYWTTGATGAGAAAVISGNTGKLSTRNDFTYASGDLAAITTSTTDTDVTFDFKFSNSEEQFLNIQLRAGSDYTASVYSTTGYNFQIEAASNGMNIYKGTDTNTSLGSLSYSLATVQWNRVRVQVIGSTLKAKIWASTAAEPAAWGITVTDTTFAASGKVLLSLFNGAVAKTQSVQIDNFVVTNGTVSSNQFAAMAAAGLVNKVYNGTTEVAATLTIYNGTTEIAVAKEERMPSGISVTKMSQVASQPFFIAHRGGSADWAEHSMRGNTQSVYLKMDGIEISLSRTSDGVWFGLHDQYLNRTTPTAPANYDPSLHTWAEISAFQCIAPSGGDATFGAQPYCKLTDALAAYAKSHVIFLDPKYVSSTYYSELLNIMDANGGTDRFIAKFAGGGEQWSVAAKARGYKSWGYFYAADVDSAALNSTTAAKYDFLGMEYNVAASYWTTVKSYGKPVIAHIAPDAAGAASGISQGAVGVMCSGVRSVMASYRP